MNEMYEVQPLPKEWCVGCFANGCYPWNTNPALLCSHLGGLYIALWESGDNIGCCLGFKPVCKETWKDYLSDSQREAKEFEELRRKAIFGKVFTNQKMLRKAK